MKQQTLRIDPEFKAQIPPLTEDERKQLEENILADGEILSPILVWNDTIVDGHNRYEILQNHPEIPFTVYPLSPAAATPWIKNFWQTRYTMMSGTSAPS